MHASETQGAWKSARVALFQIDLQQRGFEFALMMIIATNDLKGFDIMVVIKASRQQLLHSGRL